MVACIDYLEGLVRIANVTITSYRLSFISSTLDLLNAN